MDSTTLNAALVFLAGIKATETKVSVDQDQSDATVMVASAGSVDQTVETCNASLNQINAAYIGIVRLWPVIKVAKDEVAAAQRVQTKEALVAIREAKEAQKVKDREEAKAAKAAKAKEKAEVSAALKQARAEAKAAAVKAKQEAKDAAAKAKADAKAAVDAAKAKAVEAKRVADTAKATAAAVKLDAQHKLPASAKAAVRPAAGEGITRVELKHAAPTGKVVVLASLANKPGRPGHK